VDLASRAMMPPLKSIKDRAGVISGAIFSFFAIRMKYNGIEGVENGAHGEIA
jgi:hypothetical protein